MIPAEILPELSTDDLMQLADWLWKIPVKCIPTHKLTMLALMLSRNLEELADLRRQT